ncbi:hypothetical protein [Nonomuraea zeae]|uniref:hypothetical protein n=1 Tax=Nonomuraea zeae TaxID=1642303 RepID=UPI003610B0FA
MARSSSGQGSPLPDGLTPWEPSSPAPRSPRTATIALADALHRGCTDYPALADQAALTR